VRAHVADILNSRFPEFRYVDVVQTVIGPVDLKKIGVIKEARFRVNPDGN